MKQIVLTLALAALGHSASAQDWSGAYVGLQSANSSYTNTYFFNGSAYGSEDGGGAMTGIFAGWTRQTGNFVLGGEISYLSGDPAFDLFPTFHFSDMLDLKARAGYSLGRVLPYAVLGWSRTEFMNGPLVPVDADGIAYGLGADVKLADRVVVGLEYLKRNLTGDEFIEYPGQNIESDFSTVTFRITYTF